MSDRLAPEREAEIVEHLASTDNHTLGNIAARELLAELAAVRAERDQLADRVAELEAWAHGCDGEGCAIPHSSWCERAKKAAAENNGCTCPQPWKGHPQPHAGYCWLVSPPRNEIEEMRRALAAARVNGLRYAAGLVDQAFHGEPYLNYPPDFADLLRQHADRLETTTLEEAQQ
jgi:hypothetical protein